MTFIRPRAWVCDSTISAFMMLINQGSILAFDKSFVIFLRNFVYQRTVKTHADFLRRLFGRRFDQVLSRLNISRTVLIPLSNADVQGKKRNHWGLTVLHKPSETLRVYDSKHRTFMFNDIIPHILRLANSIQSLYVKRLWTVYKGAEEG